MNDLKFNLTAIIEPTCKEEYLLVLNEALRLLDELNEQLDKIMKDYSE